MFLEVLGDPWVSPERSKCCYFVSFRWFSELLCFLMFFIDISRRRCFDETQKKTYSFYIDSGGSECCYFAGFSYDCGNIRFFAGAFSMNSFHDFDGKIMCIGGAQEHKTMEIHVRT